MQRLTNIKMLNVTLYKYICKLQILKHSLTFQSEAMDFVVLYIRIYITNVTSLILFD